MRLRDDCEAGKLTVEEYTQWMEGYFPNRKKKNVAVHHIHGVQTVFVVAGHHIGSAFLRVLLLKTGQGDHDIAGQVLVLAFGGAEIPPHFLPGNSSSPS